ncbi:hypothetical protein [Embleya sp. NPDC005971]|uniref:hypothetical protein n=1 Tax=Embleya sp. NPDC005971 TaxID=3156724 RepID=UPI0033D70743
MAANGLLLWSLAHDAVAGSVGIGEVVLFAQATAGVSALAFGGLSWALPPAAHSVAAVLALETEMAEAGRLTTGERSADALPRTALLDGTRVAEHGTHEELLARGGPYAELYGIQESSYRAGYRLGGDRGEDA